MNVQTLSIDIPVLTTARLTLSAPSEAEFPQLVEFYNSDRSAFVGGPLHRNDVWRGLMSVIGHWITRGYGFWSVWETASQRFIGRVGLWNPDGWPEPEIGWTLMGGAEGKGYAHEAALAARDHAYQDLGWTTAISLIDRDNTRSQALAQRLGAVREAGYTHPKFGETDIWRHPGPDQATGAPA